MWSILRFAPSLSSSANHVEYVDLCKNVFGVSASPLLRFVSELQVSRRCWGLVAVDACVRLRERMQCCLVHEKPWNNFGVGEIRSHVFVPDVDYAARN